MKHPKRRVIKRLREKDVDFVVFRQDAAFYMETICKEGNSWVDEITPDTVAALIKK